MPPVAPLHPLPSPRLPRPTSLRDPDEIKAANAAAAQEIARELDQLAWRSAVPQAGAIGPPAPRSSTRVPAPQSSYDMGITRSSTEHVGPPPTLSLNFTDADAHLDFPGMTLQSPTETTNRQPSLTYNTSPGRRSPPPTFEMATNPPTPSAEPKLSKPQPTVDTDTQALPGRSPSTVSGASHVSTGSSLSTLPAPNPPFRSVNPSKGTTDTMPMSPADGAPITPRTISAGAFKRFRGSSLSPAGPGIAPPPLSEQPSYNSEASGGSNYASAPSSPTGGRPMGSISRSVSGPQSRPTPAYDPSPLRGGDLPNAQSQTYLAPEGEVGMALGSPSNSYPDGFANKNRFTIGDAGWKPGMPGRYESSNGSGIGLGDPPSEGNNPPARRGGYGSGNYATALE